MTQVIERAKTKLVPRIVVVNFRSLYGLVYSRTTKTMCLYVFSLIDFCIQLCTFQASHGRCVCPLCHSFDNEHAQAMTTQHVQFKVFVRSFGAVGSFIPCLLICWAFHGVCVWATCLQHAATRHHQRHARCMVRA